jgi:hypothetical protein
MERTLSATRIFSLGNYQNLQVTNSLTNVPEELALDQEFIRNVTKLQLIEIESQYVNYAILRNVIGHAQSLEEEQLYLEEERNKTVEELFKNTKLNDYIEQLMKPKES